MSNNTERIINHQDALDIIKELKGINEGINASAISQGAYQVNTFAELQHLVREGLAHKALSVGDQIVVTKETAISISSTNAGLTLTIDADAFIAKMGETGNKDYEATYDGIEWHDGLENIVLSEYGITCTGTPEEGDKILVHETASEILFDVVAFDYETPEDNTRTHSLTLLMHYTFTGVQFDAPEAIWYFPNGLPAGSYSFTIASGYDSSYGGNGATYYFTLANAIPAKGQIRFDWGYQQQASSRSIVVYASATATSASETVSVSATSIEGAVSLGTIGNGGISTDLSVTVGGTAYAYQANNIEAMRYGLNVWEQSAIRQWMNSDKKKGNVWAPQNVFDRPPSWASTLDGFWYGVDPSFRKICGKCVKKTLGNNKTNGSAVVNTNDLAWAISMGEMGVSGWGSEGSQLPYYTKLMNGTTISDWGTYAKLIRTNSAGSAQYWWLRSPSVGSAYYARVVSPSGTVGSNYAYYGFQALVALAII